MTAHAYDGAYTKDARWLDIQKRLPERLDRARESVGRYLRRSIEAITLRVVDAGADRSGAFAYSDGETITLYSEHLVLGRYDVDALLRHEVFHVVHRRALGAHKFAKTPRWAREGAAMYVAGQAPARLAVLAVHAVRTGREDPAGWLLNPNAPAFVQYFRYGAEFLALERATSKPRARDAIVAMLAGVLFDPTVHAAELKALTADVVRAPKKQWDNIRAADSASERRKRMTGIVQKKLDRANVSLDLARMLARAGEYGRALAVLRAGVLAHPRTSTQFGGAALLELTVLREHDAAAFTKALAHARIDLKPYPIYEDVLALAEKRAE